MTPRVTVLVAVKDGLPWVREAVESVLAQTWKDCELLVVDDGSADGTAEAVEGYGDPRIRVLRNERNVGQVPSLNRGLEQARGEYVARLDADDRMLPERLARQVAVLDAEPSVALVGTWMDVVDEQGRLWAELRGRIRDFPEFVLAILADRYPFAHPSLMVRLEALRALGGYDPSLAPSEDKDLYRRLALARRDARAVEAPLTVYRRHERQLSQERRAEQERNDHLGQERFLAELCGAGAPVTALRLLLADDPEAWRLDVDYPAGLAGLLAGARRRLELSADEAAELERLLALHLAGVAAGAWRAGLRLAWRRSPAVFRFAALRGAARRTPAYAASLVLGPLLRPPLERARAASRSPALGRVRDVTRRSRLLRSLYARLPGR